MRTWPGLAALGAGIVHLGIAAGSPPLLLAALALIGAAETLWGVLALARPVPLGPGVALVAAAVLVGAWILALLLPAAMGHHGGGGPVLPVGPAGGAALLDLAVAAVLALRLRRADAGPRGTAAFLLGAAVAAAVVAAVVVISLAGTSVGGGMQMSEADVRTSGA